jgi:hypothetical protein
VLSVPWTQGTAVIVGLEARTQVGEFAVDGLPASAWLPLGAPHGLLLADRSASHPAEQICTNQTRRSANLQK